MGLKCSLLDKREHEIFPHNPTRLELNFQENIKFWSGNHFLKKKNWVKKIQFYQIINDTKIMNDKKSHYHSRPHDTREGSIRKFSLISIQMYTYTLILRKKVFQRFLYASEFKHSIESQRIFKFQNYYFLSVWNLSNF